MPHPFQSSRMGLLSGDLDQFDAPVPGPSVVGLGGHGRPGSGAEGHQARGGDAVPGDQIGDDRLARAWESFKLAVASPTMSVCPTIQPSARVVVSSLAISSMAGPDSGLMSLLAVSKKMPGTSTWPSRRGRP